MAILYYGDNGICNIEGLGIRGVEIRYKGTRIEIEKTASDSFALAHHNNGIILFPIGDGFLNELFTYKGNMEIMSVLAADNDGKKVYCRIKKEMDYSETLESKAEDMTVKSEDLKSSRLSVKNITKYDGIIKNLYSHGEFYLENNTIYTGLYHIHIKDSSCMTGGEHTKGSVDLYYKQVLKGVVVDRLISTRNPKHGVPALGLRRKKKRPTGKVGQLIQEKRKK